MNAILPVATAIDDNYVYPLLVTAFSAAENGPPEQRWIVASDPSLLSSASRELIVDVLGSLGVLAEFMQLEVASRFSDNGHIKATSFARLPLADVLDDFLWLDVDIQCREGWQHLLDVEPLFESKATVQARPMGDTMNWRAATERNVAFERARSRYFNSGIMRISGSRWRDRGFAAAWPELLSRYEELGFEWSDQCVLNYLFAGDYLDLAAPDNCGPEERLPDDQAPRIVHFAGAGKPWRYANDSRFLRDNPRRERLVDYWSAQERLHAHLCGADPQAARIVHALAADLRIHAPWELGRSWQRFQRLSARVRRNLPRRIALG